jgi:prepilin-type N-terminal cleavage/methylation domain-containing protein
LRDHAIPPFREKLKEQARGMRNESMRVVGKRNMEAVTRQRQRGFSLAELMLVLAILATVIGIVTSAIAEVEKKSASDVNKVGLAQESRQFMDQILHDLRQAGYPSLAMFDASTLTSSTDCTRDLNVACGLRSFSSSAVQFEGDIDGSGVSEVYIQVVVSASGNCPCTVQRGTVQKTNPPGTPAYYTELDNLMSQNIFTAYKYDGTAYNSSTDSLSNIKDIGITLYVQSPLPDVNETSTTYPTTTMVSEARINN